MTCDVPQEPSELSGDGDADFVYMHLAGEQPAISMREAQLRSPGDVAHDLRLTLLAARDRKAQTGREAVVPGGFDQGLHAPAFALDSQRFGEPLDPLVRVANGLPIFGEGNSLCRMREADVGERAITGRRPRLASAISMSMTQQHGLQLLPCLET